VWRPDQLAGEAYRNLGPAHVVLGLLLALIVAGVAGYVGVQAQQALGQEAELRAAGSLVWVAAASDEGRSLDGTACGRLGAIPGVAAAGGVAASSVGPVYAFSGSRTPVRAVGLTPGALQVFVADAPPATPTLGRDLAALAGVGAGQWLIEDTGERTIHLEAVVDDAPSSLLTSTVTVPVLADTPLDACWIRMKPGAVAAGGDLLSFTYPDGQAVITRFLPEATGVLRPVEQWRAAMAVQPWLVGAAVIAITVVLVNWTRRTEHAVYRTFGTTRPALLLMITVELLLVALPAVAGAAVVASALAAIRWQGLPGAVLEVAVTQALASLLTGLIAGTALTPLLQRSDLAEVLRDR